MNQNPLLDEFVRLKEVARLEELERKASVAEKLAIKVRTAYENNSEAIDALIKEEIVKTGAVYLGGFGCICGDGFCINQRGYEKHLQDIQLHWEEQGMTVRWYGMTGIILIIKGLGSYSLRSSINAHTLEVHNVT